MLTGGLLLAAGAAAAAQVQDPDAAPVTAREATAPAGPATAGHLRMAAALADIARSAKETSLYTGVHEAREAREAWAALDGTSPALKRWRSLRRLAFHELRLGEAEAAIAALERALELVPQVADRVPPRAIDQVRLDLGVAWMRLGETRNCVALHTSESCILPIRGSGVHADQEGSRNAIQAFAEVLRRDPGNVSARWLLNIAAMTVGAWPDEVPEPWRIAPRTFESDEPFPRFAEVAPERGVDAFDLAGGVVVDDLDGDGVLDVLTSTMDPEGPLHLYRGLGGGRFEERTQAANLAGILGGLNMVQADYDNDGWTDVLVLRGAWLGAAGRRPNSLLRNNGDGTFTDVTYEAGLAEPAYPTQTAAWADYDNDGHLDLYVGNECDPNVDAPCQLFRNRGDGTFEDVAKEAGVDNRHFAKAVVWGDVDGDGWPDLFVSNQNGPNRLYRNRGDGTFEDIAAKAGVVLPLASFPAWFWDFDDDGNLDLFVGAYTPALEPVAASWLGLPTRAERAALYRGDGQGRFQDVAEQAGLTRVTLPMGSNFGDLDDDGRLDFYLGTGYPGYDGLMPNVMYRNVDGRRFADVTTAGGFGHLQKGHGVAFADLDGDGDTDVYEQMGGAFPGDAFGNALYLNPGFGHRALTVLCVGTRSNRSAIGARIRCEVVSGEGEARTRRSLYRWVNSGGSFGCNPLRQRIGLGKHGRVALLEVHWPTSDTTQTFRDVEAGRTVVAVEGEDTLAELQPRGSR